MKIFDPACGSGSFLVRAYHRKAHLNPGAAHQDRIAEIYGTDVSFFAAHLATLNLASRDIGEEEMVLIGQRDVRNGDASH